MKINIIQPTTYERNLGGICYMPYWIYTCYRELSREVYIYENFTIRDLDLIKLGLNDIVLIDLSSYPQINLAQYFYRELRAKVKKIEFIGYKPLIDYLKLPYLSDKIDILNGVFNYIFYNKEYKYGLLSDCDAHLSQQNRNKKVVPIFLSVGCKRGCSFCYASYSNYPYGIASEKQISKIINYCNKENYDIHFCDENFFNNKKIKFVINELKNKDIKYICLTDTINLDNIISNKSTITVDDLHDSGNSLNEVGLENYLYQSSNKLQKIENLVESNLNIFWLTMTFMPNETIYSQNKTGEFLNKYGWKLEDLLPRIRTNSTEAGLGQFFQLYHGIPAFNEYRNKGKIFNEYPVRLYPSYIGYDYLNEIPKIVRKLINSDEKWFNLYGNNLKDADELFFKIDNKTKINELIDNDLNNAILLAQFARLRIIS